MVKVTFQYVSPLLRIYQKLMGMVKYRNLRSKSMNEPYGCSLFDDERLFYFAWNWFSRARQQVARETRRFVTN